MHRGSDGRFKSGPLAGKSINIKMYGKREGRLDIRPEYPPDYYLVLTGLRSTAMSSRKKTRPWAVNEVFLFEAKPLINRLLKREIKIGTATSVVIAEWNAARIYPVSSGSSLELTKVQKDYIQLFDS